MSRLLDFLNPTPRVAADPPSSALLPDDPTSAPSDLPAALPHRRRGHYEGRIVLANAVVDFEMPADLPVELVPPEEAATVAPLLLQEGGCFVFSDDYVHRYPHSKVAEMIREFQDIKKAEMKRQREKEGLTEWAESPEDDDPLGTLATAGPTRSNSTLSSISSASSSVSNRSFNKLQHIRDIVREAKRVDRPLFRLRDPVLVYGESQYTKRTL